MITNRRGSTVHVRVGALISAVAAMGAQEPLTNDSATPRLERVLAALVDFKDVDEAQRHFSREDIIKLLEQNNDSLERFTWETSRNLINVDFDVLDWITVDKHRTDYPLGGDGVVEDAVSAISFHADLSQYDKVLLFIYPLEQGYPGCQAYLGPVPWNTPNGVFDLGAAWLSGYDMGCVRKGRIAHEYMHTFGFVHSYAISCKKGPPVPASLIDPTDKNDSCFDNFCVDDDCTETRPGDSGIIANKDWDVLGGDHRYEELFPLHVHATWQAQAGWLGEDQVIETRTRGSYRITTLESLDSGPKAIRVPLGLNHRGEPAYYWLQTREFSPWTFAFWRSVEDLSPCQVDVRLEATAVFGGEGGHPGSSAYKNTYIFDGNSFELPDGRESIARPRKPFHDPYRGIRMEIADCVEGGDGTAIEVLIETTALTVGPAIVAQLDDEQTTATITVTNGGRTTVTVGSAVIGGRHPDAFSVLSDGCGQLQLGASCAIVVSYDGDAVGNPNHHAVLKIPNDDGLAPQLSVSLFGEVGRTEDANRRPVVLENLPDRSLAAVGALEVDVSGAFGDPDGETLSYTVSSSAPQVVATRVAGAVVTLTAANEGVAAIRVTATDPGGLSATQSFGVTVGRPNRPPEAVGVLSSLTLGVDDAAVTVEVGGAFRDPDGDALTYRASSSSPVVASVAVVGSGVAVTPVAEGVATVTVTATDAAGSNGTAMQTFAVTVGPAANRPPEPVGALLPLTLGVDDAAVTVEVGGAFRDPDGDALTYRASSSSPVVASVAVVGSGVAVTPVAEGVATVTVTATDAAGSNGTAMQTFAVTVGPAANRPPEPVGALLPLTLGVDDAAVTVEVGGAFRDPDGDALTYRASSSSPVVASVAVVGSGVAVTPVAEGVATVTVTATDAAGSNGTAMQTFAVTVGPAANRPPEPVGALLPLTLGVDDAAVTVEVGGAFRDPDGDALTYRASSSSPRVVTVRAAGARVTLAAVALGRAVIEVTATDPDGLSATQSFWVRVTAPFTDDPIQPGVTPVRAVHFTELRLRIDILRREAGLASFPWTDPELRAGVTAVKLAHLLEFREALSEAYASAGRSVPRWTDASPAAGSTPIRALHVTELRAAVLALE